MGSLTLYPKRVASASRCFLMIMMPEELADSFPQRDKRKIAGPLFGNHD
jgi:hypothetical protein